MRRTGRPNATRWSLRQRSDHAVTFGVRSAFFIEASPNILRLDDGGGRRFDIPFGFTLEFERFGFGERGFLRHPVMVTDAVDEHLVQS